MVGWKCEIKDSGAGRNTLVMIRETADGRRVFDIIRERRTIMGNYITGMRMPEIMKPAIQEMLIGIEAARTKQTRQQYI